MNTAVKVNAWEIDNEADALTALAGRDTPEEIVRDRQRRAIEVVKGCRVSPHSVGFEIGSGNGLVAQTLSHQCARIDCNDISQSFLALAKATCRDAENVRFHLIKDAFLSHLPSSAYDFGYSLNVFIHLNPFDMFNYLLDVTRLLKPGGRFVFDACTLGPKTRELFREHAGLYRRDPAGVRGLLCFNDPGAIHSVVREAGLRVVKQSGSDWMKFLVQAS